MQPKLELVYNSQAGNGLLGMGWNLSGLSAITRCPRTRAQDGVMGGVNFDANDRYCLDGQRLILVSGTYGAAGSEYRTEIESFSKITALGAAGNGPASFVVKTKSGLTLEYGNTADSRIEAVKAAGSTASWPTGTVRVWANNKTSDIKGNYYTTSYVEDSANGGYYPSRMDYTGNSAAGTQPTSLVRFSYLSNRTDAAWAFLAGSTSRQVRLLGSIQTYADSVLAKELSLNFAVAVKSKRSTLQSIRECASPSICKPQIELITNDSNSLLSGNPIVSSINSVDQNWLLQIADANRDGIMDILRVKNTGEVTVSLGRLDGTFSSETLTTSITGYNVGGCQGCDWERFVADMNGDGIADVVRVRDTGDIHVFLGKGDGYFQTSAIGTGNGDMGLSWSRSIADVNGDGMPDIVRIRNTGDVAVWLGRGDGRFNASYTNTGISGYNVGGCQGCDWERFVADMNGDGIADVVRVRDTGDIHVFLGKGDGYFQIAPISITADQLDQSWRRLIEDVGGQGARSVVRVSDAGTVKVFAANGVNLDAVKSISIISGTQLSLQYHSVVDSSTYVMSTGSQYPIHDVTIGNFSFVSSVSKSNGVGGSNVTTYSYGGLKAELGTGRGMLGFRWTKSKEESTGIESYTEYSQEFPYTGMALKSETRLVGGSSPVLLKRSTSTPQCNIPQTGAACTVAAGNRYFPYVESGQEESWDLSGVAYPVISTNTQYAQVPNYGDPTRIVVSTSDGTSKTTENEYWPADTANWVLGRLKKATVTSVAP